jgi:glucose dehydrogenase
MVASTLALPGSDSTPVLFRGDAQHTGTCPDSKVPAGKVKWSFQTGNKIRSSPALYNGVVYFGSDDDHLYALDIQTGKLQWKFQAAGAVSSSPTVYHGTVYIEAGDAAFHAVDANTGREKWTVKTDAPIPPDPKLMSNGKWEFEHASPVIAGDAVYFGSADGNLYALDPATGKQMWRFKTAGRIRATPAIADGVVTSAAWTAISMLSAPGPAPRSGNSRRLETGTFRSARCNPPPLLAMACSTSAHEMAPSTLSTLRREH